VSPGGLCPVARAYRFPLSAGHPPPAVGVPKPHFPLLDFRLSRQSPLAAAIAVLLLHSLTAAAEEPGVSPDELEEFRRALGEDAPAQKPAPAEAPAQALPSASNAAAGVGFALPGVLISLQSMNPDMSFILDVAGARFSREPSLQTGGHDPQRTGFNLQQLELAIGRTVDPYFRFDGNIVFAQFGVEIEEAYATTLSLPAQLQVRAGQFLTRFGRINPTHVHSWDFVDQPLAVGRIFGSEGNRGLGAELSWLAPLPWYAELVGSATSANGQATARSFYGNRDLGVRSPLDLQLTGALKQFFEISEDVSILWGLSAASGPNPAGNQTFTHVYGTDLYVKYRPLRDTGWMSLALQAEANWRRRQVVGDVLSDVTGYAQVVYRWHQQWSAAVRTEVGAPAVGLSGQVVSDPLDPSWTDVRHRHSANLTFYPTEFSRIRLQGSMDVPTWEDRPRYAAFLAFEVVVGAHGAHKF